MTSLPPDPPDVFNPTVTPPTHILATLRATMTDASLPPSTRLAAGLQATDLGDLPSDLDELVGMPAKAQLGYEFRIAQYPVTNHQYRRFIEAGGYTDDRWWQDKAGRDHRSQIQRRQPGYWNNARFNRATQPVVGITWREAMVYCTWLTAQWQAAGQIGPDEQVQLPSQAEWVLAARSGQPQPSAKAIDYPWQGVFDPAHANTQESGLGQTTPVHMYPSGCTPLGVYDLSGNIWEWIRDPGHFYHSLKGGGWRQNAGMTSAAASSVWTDGRWSDNIGLRVVVTPTGH